MDELIWIGAGAALGAALSGVAALLRQGAKNRELARVEARARLLDDELTRRDEVLASVREELDSVDHQRETAARRVAVLESELKSRDERFEQEKTIRDEMESRLRDTFTSLGSRALASNNKQFIDLATEKFSGLMKEARGGFEQKQEAIDAMVKPIRELLEKQNTTLAEIEKKRVEETGGITEQLKHIAEAHTSLKTETSRLVTALRRPEQRGRWGEMQLRNVVEMAGMSAHCDFDEQVTVWTGETKQRPDMVARMPGGGVIVIDSKVALDAYLSAIQADSDREAEMRRHADLVEKHYRSLARKEYWNAFERTPKLVVMFMPLESALMAALETKPDLHAEAMRNHVLIATPTLLVALLRAIAYGWQQEDVAANAREIARVGQELYGRLSKFAGDFEALGQHLSRATRAYNGTIGSFERRVLPSTRKLKALNVTTYDEIESPPQVELEVRTLQVDELKSDVVDELFGPIDAEPARE